MEKVQKLVHMIQLLVTDVLWPVGLHLSGLDMLLTGMVICVKTFYAIIQGLHEFLTTGRFGKDMDDKMINMLPHVCFHQGKTRFDIAGHGANMEAALCAALECLSAELHTQTWSGWQLSYAMRMETRPSSRML